MEKWMFLVPAAAVIALLFAVYLANKVSRQSVGTCLLYTSRCV